MRIFLLALFSIMSFGSANALTYDISATGAVTTVSGTVTLDAFGNILGENISAVVAGSPQFSATFTNLPSSSVVAQGASTYWNLDFGNGSSTTLNLLLENANPWSDQSVFNLVWFSSYSVSAGFSDILSGTLTAEVSATPLPAALPLYATGLGALALLRWRRKRKAALVA
jgi:hypothetical protein